MRCPFRSDPPKVASPLCPRFGRGGQPWQVRTRAEIHFVTALPNHRHVVTKGRNAVQSQDRRTAVHRQGFQVQQDHTALAVGAGGASCLPLPHPRGRLTSRAEQAEFAQLYVQACCSAPPHDSVCRLLGWGSPDSADGTLSGLEEGAVIYMVLEDAGAEVDAVYPPEESLQYFKQIVSGPPRRFVTESFSALSGVVHAQACITCTAATSSTAT